MYQFPECFDIDCPHKSLLLFMACSYQVTLTRAHTLQASVTDNLSLPTCLQRNAKSVEETLRYTLKPAGRSSWTESRVPSYTMVNVNLVYIDISGIVGKGSSNLNTWGECQAADNEYLWHTGASSAAG